jgi:hypothetical protein
MSHVSINLNCKSTIALSAVDVDSIADLKDLAVSQWQIVGQSLLNRHRLKPVFSKNARQAYLVSFVPL